MSSGNTPIGPAPVIIKQDSAQNLPPEKVLEIMEYLEKALSDILEVRSGWKTDNFNKASASQKFHDEVQELCCFSIVFRHIILFNKSVDLVAQTPDDAKTWVEGLKHLIKAIKSQNMHFNEEQWLIERFREADKNNNGSLTFDEVWALLKDLNLEISEEYGKKIFVSADTRKTKSKFGEDALDREEFLKFFFYLTQRKELDDLMSDYSGANGDFFLPEDLQNFLIDAQGYERSKITIEFCQNLMQKFEPDAKNKEDRILSPNGFRRLLLSEWGRIMQIKQTSVCQDMHYPLQCYFINSSHNTYLLGGQLRGQASVEGYVNALVHGARLLELDCWDGEEDDEGPIITHGHTLVTPIRLKSAVKAIAQYAFQASPYPVILSIENHCSIDMQRKMAHIFTEYLGDLLCREKFSSLEHLPSPEVLKNKILIKAKRLPFDVADGEASEGEVSEDDVEGESDREEDAVDGAGGKKSKKKGALSLAAELSNIVALPAHKLHNLNVDVKEHPADSFVSLGENKVLGILEEDEEYDKLVTYTAKHMAKAYPKGLRTDSTNMGPMPMWIAGIQCVTMNMQTSGEEMDLNNGFFLSNGGSGYVLKPDSLRNGTLTRKDLENKPEALNLKIRIISGQYLPKPDAEEDVVDPYVTVEIYGLSIDCQKVRTEVIKNNGFNPVWNQTFNMPIRAPEYALVRFCVKDYDRTSYNDFIGQYTIPVTCIRNGFSHLRLRTGFTHDEDPSATIFVEAHLSKVDNLV